MAAVISILFCGVTVNASGYRHDNEAPYIFYSISGKEFDRGLSMSLQEYLAREGIEWWLPYAVCQAFQESSFDPEQITVYSSGTDCGLFQFRERFWEDHCRMAGVYGDIMDPHVQLQVYAKVVAQRIHSGRTTAETISDWYTGGEGYSQEYVDAVLQWEERMEISEKE